MTNERRKERRYIVVGMDALLGGETCPILDISRSAVRLLKPATLPALDQPVTFFLRTHGRTRSSRREYELSGRFIRATRLDITFGYDPPAPRWEATLRRHDTFQCAHLLKM